MIPASRLLKSCAMPPVSWPMASILCDWRSCSSVRSRSRVLLLHPGFERRVQVLQRLLGTLAFRDVH